MYSDPLENGSSSSMEELVGATYAMDLTSSTPSTPTSEISPPPSAGKKKAEPKPNPSAGPSPTVSSLIFLGTGTSSQVPAIGCLTNPKSTCRVCPSSLHRATQKNRRRNTSALLTLSNSKTILIDCGKSFFDAALAIWPRARLRKIDALLLTHAHADAINGLDDLRGWTLGGFIQQTIEIYCSKATFEAVREMYPYMVDTAKATGGGDVPAFKWNIIPALHCEFYVPSCEVGVTTLPVEHGRYFDEQRTPFVCLGFQIGGVCYVSDTSRIPARTREKMQDCEVLVLDALKWGTHPSHFGIGEALEFVNGLERPPKKTYLVDFTHEVDHYSFEEKLRKEQKLDIAPAYDGLQVLFGGGSDGEVGDRTEVDLLAEREWVAVCEADKGGPEANGTAKVKTMV